MADNLAQLDQGGSNAQWNRTYLGPTVGWVMLPVMPEVFVTSAAAYTVPNYASRVLLRAAVTSVLLPDVNKWVTSPFQAVQSAFDRSLWVKDLSGTFFASPCTFTPFAGQTIDGLATYQVVSNHALIRFYPLTDLTGWYVG